MRVIDRKGEIETECVCVCVCVCVCECVLYVFPNHLAQAFLERKKEQLDKSVGVFDRDRTSRFASKWNTRDPSHVQYEHRRPPGPTHQYCAIGTYSSGQVIPFFFFF